MGLKKQTASGVKWLFIGSIAQRIISLAATIVLVRILNPSIFGLFALGFIFIDGFSLFKSMGFDSALIQRKDKIEEAADTAFIVMPTLSIILYFILFFSAPFIGKLFEVSDLPVLLRTLGLIFVISCFGRVPIALLEKHLRFDIVAISDILGQFVNSALAVVLAFSGWGLWSLVYGYLVRTIIQLAIVWKGAGWKPHLRFDKLLAIDMFHFGKYMLLNSIAWFLRKNLDRLFISKLLGVVMLGIYAIAYNFADLINEYLGSKFQRVLFPTYAKFQDDASGMQAAFLKSLKWISLITIPAGVTIYLVGGDFLRLAFGVKWLAAVPVLKILIWGGIFYVLDSCNRCIFIALKKAKLNFYVTLIQIGIYLIFIAPAAKLYGLNGVSIIVVASYGITMVITFAMVIKLLKLKFSQIYFSIQNTVVISVVMAMVVVVERHLAANSIVNSTVLLKLSVSLCLELLVYVLLVVTMEKSVIAEAKVLLAK